MIGPFTSNLNQYLFFGTFIIWCLSLILERFTIKMRAKRIVKRKEDKGTYILIYLSIILSIVISINLGYREIALLPEIVFYVGIISILLGIFIREYSVITLGKFFSFQISVIEKHKLIENGPYHYIRHPAYTGGILSIIGISISLRSMIAVIIVIIMSTIAYGSRIKYEEKILVHEFGEEYIRYRNKTKKLIPLIY